MFENSPAGAKFRMWFFLLLFGGAFRLFSQQFIVSDTAEGVFREDQVLSFELSSPGTLRLLLDGREIYAGEGPAYPELGVPGGEEREFTLRAEYYSPDKELLESRSWQIRIDKKPPHLPVFGFRYTKDGLRLFREGGEQGAKILVLADIEGKSVFFQDFAAAEFNQTASFHALVWAEDAAGNRSEFGGEYFEVPPPRIENPVPGEWLNPQTLVISGAEGKEVYWTADGSNPLEQGGTGRLYRGPRLVEKTGKITLRIAWKDSAGRVHEDTALYSAAESSAGESPEETLFAALRTAGEREIRSPVTLSVPGQRRWSLGDFPVRGEGGSVTLRPEHGIKRTVALHITDGKSSASRRYVYLLDGTAETEANEKDADDGERKESVPRAAFPVEETVLRPEQDGVPLALVSSGRNRLVLWPETRGELFYSLDGGSWHEGGKFLPVPFEGGLLRWFTLDKEGGGEESAAEGKDSGFLAGPYSVSLPSLAEGKRPAELLSAAGSPAQGSAQTEKIRGRIACRAFNGNSGRAYVPVSDLLDYIPGMVKFRRFDVCDGEDLEWAFISEGGNILEQRRRDRLAPPAPGFTAPAEASWNRGPVKVSVSSGEKDVSGFLSARLRYASGATEIISGTGSLDIVSSLGEEAEVTVEAFLMDSSGNRGLRTVRSFLLDPKTVYVSPAPLVTGTSAEAGPPGGMDNPFSSLEEAVRYAQERGIVDIRVAGTVELKSPLTVLGNIRIDGGWKMSGDTAPNGGEKPLAEEKSAGALLVLGEGFYWDIKTGADFTLLGLRAERKKGNLPLFRAEENTRLEIAASGLVCAGPFLDISGGICAIRDSGLRVTISGERRTAAFSARESVMRISGSRIQLEGNYSLLFDLLDGSFSAGDSVFLAAGLRSASLFALNGTRTALENLTLSAAARDYASVLEAAAAGLIVNGGTLGVSARDTDAVLLNNSSALFNDTLFRVEGSFAARALEIRGRFPRVQDCRFSFEGSAGSPEVFSGTEAAAPSAGSVTGNRFSGFTRIWGAAWPAENLPAFNRAYALPEKPNSLEAFTLPGISSFGLPSGAAP